MGYAKAENKKLFAHQAEVYAAYVAYTDHEIGRVIQAVEDVGKLDNTLIVYISGDNGASPEGPVGTPNQMASFNGILDSGPSKMKIYDAWGSDKTFPHMSVAGRGRLIRRSSGPSRWPPTSGEPSRAWAWPGPTASRTKVAFATSSTT